MENILLRVPSICDKIFDELDDENLTKCRLLNRSFCAFLDKSRLVSLRKINKYNQNHVQFKESWNLVMEKMPLETMKQLASATQDFYTRVFRVITDLFGLVIFR